ncbi:MAG: VOC family protein [Candidatus Lustribacter sp.]|jgi:hypothetical protein
MNDIPAQGLRHVTVVVGDARATAQKYASVHGTTEWKVRRYDAARLRDATTHGFFANHEYLTATGVVAAKSGPVTFVLVQPLGGWTTYHEFLNTRGEGIHSICVALVTPDELSSLRSWLAERGVEVAQSACRDDAVDTYAFDTREKLGGFYVEVLAPRSADWESRERADEVWNFAATTADEPLMLLGGIGHFGVVVPDLIAAVRNYAELFGISDFTFRNWRNAPGSLDRPTYLGRPVEHAYFTTIVTPAKGLSFEVIQPTLGPSHYKEDFLQAIGPGIHHINSGMIDDAGSWEAVRDRMAGVGAPVVMSGGILENFLDFYYLDTRRALAGYVTEVTVPGSNFAKGRPNVPFAMVADLSRPVPNEHAVPAMVR